MSEKMKVSKIVKIDSDERYIFVLDKCTDFETARLLADQLAEWWLDEAQRTLVLFGGDIKIAKASQIEIDEGYAPTIWERRSVPEESG